MLVRSMLSFCLYICTVYMCVQYCYFLCACNITNEHFSSTTRAPPPSCCQLVLKVDFDCIWSSHVPQQMKSHLPVPPPLYRWGGGTGRWDRKVGWGGGMGRWDGEVGWGGGIRRWDGEVEWEETHCTRLLNTYIVHIFYHSLHSLTVLRAIFSTLS